MENGTEREKRIPAYIRLYCRVKENIIDGSYPYGSKLPSKRVMADESKVSTITVEHAYEQLAAEGYIETRERSGYFVVFRAHDGFAVSAEKFELPHESYGVSDREDIPQFPYSVIAKTMRRVLGDCGVNILQKTCGKGCRELRETIAAYLARNRGIHVDAEQVVIGSGAEYLYGLIVELLGRDKVYGIEKPSYEKIEQVYCASGVECESLPLGSDGIESAALFGSHADVLHVTPYRSYPTGITATANKRHEYVRWSGIGGRFIIEDDFESEFSVSGIPVETLFALSEYDNIIYINTFSKTVSPAVRVGYMVLPKGLVTIFQKKLGFYSCSVPTFEQYVLTELISGGDFERHINRVRRMLRKKTGR